MAKKVWIIMADQLSHQYIGCHGFKPWVSTPHLDALSGRGASHRRAYCSSPLCVPSRQCFYTGHNTRHTSCICDSRPLVQPTMFHKLGACGVPSYGVGKMDFRFDDDQFHGLSERPGGAMGSQDIDPGVNNFSSFIGAPVTTTYRETDLQCDAITDVSLDCLARPGPGLVYTSFVKPHESSDNELGYDAPHRFFSLYNKHHFREGREWGYVANVSCLDFYVGECLRRAELRGLLDDTLVIFCGDHGEMAGAQGRWGKLCMFEQAIRVPLVVWYRGIRPEVNHEPVALIDTFPTVFEWLGLACPPCDGTSLLQPRPEGYQIFIEYLDANYWRGFYKDWKRRPINFQQGVGRLNRAIVEGCWKLTHDGTKARLFHVKNDLTDLGRVRPGTFRRLADTLEETYPAAEVLSRYAFVRETGTLL